MKAQWSAGHNWVAELPYDRVMQELARDDGKMKFKFVVKANGGVVRWEGGSDHVFDGTQLTQMLESAAVQTHINSEIVSLGLGQGNSHLPTSLSAESITIGSFAGVGQIVLHSSNESGT